MKDYSLINYKQSFLDQVIIRVDFLKFIDTETLFCEDVEKEVLRQFPHRGMDQRICFDTINVIIDPNKTSAPAKKETLEGLQREYSVGRDKIILSNKFLVYEINEYSDFDKHYKSIQEILLSLFKVSKITTARIGIRYINLYDADKIKLRKNLFSPEVSATLCARDFVSENCSQIIRAMGINEYQVENMSLKFRFGMYNPSYPNPLTKDNFALDFDCFTTEPIDTTDDVLKNIEKGHDAIQELFEKSITDNMRRVLDNE